MEPSDAVTELLTAIHSQQNAAGPSVGFADQLSLAVAGLVHPAEVCLVLWSPEAGRVEFGTTSAAISEMAEADEVLGEGPISAALLGGDIERWADDTQPHQTLAPFTSFETSPTAPAV